MIELQIVMVIAYLFGSLSSAIIVCSVMGLPDPRTLGSRNPGASNVLRIGGKKAALYTLLGDVFKGVIPVLAAKWIGLGAIGMSVAGFAAVIGHLYPIFFRFEGGKGVATFLGMLFVFSWPAAIAWIITWLVILFLFRYISIASMFASALAPVFIWYATHNFVFAITVILISIIIILRHYSNIQNLLGGTEAKFGKKL